MEKKLIYVILFYENGKFFMTSAHAFLNAGEAAACAKKFCQFYKQSVWTYEIEQLQVSKF